MTRTKTPSSPVEQVEKLRARIATINLEQNQLTAQRRSRSEVEALTAGIVKTWEREGLESLTREVNRAAAGMAPSLMGLTGIVPVQAVPGVAPVTLNAGPLLVALLGSERVSQVLAGIVESVPQGVEHDARVMRLAKIATELDELEAEEEQIVEASAGAIQRRPDARPEIVLALPLGQG